MHQAKGPCYECKERRIGCHSKCSKYNEWIVKKREESENVKKEKEVDSIIRAHVVETVEWGKKHRYK